MAKNLQAKGFTLAQGDRRGVVAVDYQGEVYALSRWAGVNSKAVKNKLGDNVTLPTVKAAKETIANTMTGRLKTYAKTVKQASLAKQTAFKAQKQSMVGQQRQERKQLQELQKERWRNESQQRHAALPKGWHKVVSFMKGELKEITRRNAQAVAKAKERDQQQKQALIDRQREERLKLQQQVKQLRQNHQKQMEQLRIHMARYQAMQQAKPLALKERFNQASHSVQKKPAVQTKSKPLHRVPNQQAGGEARSLTRAWVR